MTSTQTLKPGDLIEIFRGVYEHWAVYIGNGFVVHVASNQENPDAGVSSVKSVPAKKAMIKKELLRDVVGTNKWKINNGLDEKYNPRPAHVIVKEAKGLVGQEVSYRLLRENCEHFVNELRYGKPESRQVREIAGVIAKIASLGLGIAGLGGIIFCFLFRGR